MVRLRDTQEVANAVASLDPVALEDLVETIEDSVRDPPHRNCWGLVGYRPRWIRLRGYHVAFLIDESPADVERWSAIVIRMKPL